MPREQMIFLTFLEMLRATGGRIDDVAGMTQRAIEACEKFELCFNEARAKRVAEENAAAKAAEEAALVAAAKAAEPESPEPTA